MIDCINKILSPEQRLEIIKRALHTSPYFYKFKFPIAAEIFQPRDYQQNVGVNRDFYLTEFMANFGEVFTDTTALFNVSIYSAYLRSLYRYSASQLLPSGFICQEARLRTPYANQLFDDRQREFFPVLIRNNDRVFAEIRNLSAKSFASTLYIIMKGFNVMPEIFVSSREQEQINNSLDQDPHFQFFEFDVTQNGLNNIVKQNDNFPRLILGFGITNDSDNKVLASNATVTIKDNSRRLSLTDTEIPIEFIAPRLVNARDINRFYLPIEYYWPPLGQLEFNINNIPVGGGDAGFKFSILTRTV